MTDEQMSSSDIPMVQDARSLALEVYANSKEHGLPEAMDWHRTQMTQMFFDAFNSELCKFFSKARVRSIKHINLPKSIKTWSEK